MNSESNKNLYKYILMCIIKCENNQRIYSQTKNYSETKYNFWYILLVGAGHYSSFM